MLRRCCEVANPGGGQVARAGCGFTGRNEGGARKSRVASRHMPWSCLGCCAESALQPAASTWHRDVASARPHACGVGGAIAKVGAPSRRSARWLNARRRTSADASCHRALRASLRATWTFPSPALALAHLPRDPHISFVEAGGRGRVSYQVLAAATRTRTAGLAGVAAGARAWQRPLTPCPSAWVGRAPCLRSCWPPCRWSPPPARR